jgi:hypothetical protein
MSRAVGVVPKSAWFSKAVVTFSGLSCPIHTAILGRERDRLESLVHPSLRNLISLVLSLADFVLRCQKSVDSADQEASCIGKAEPKW